MVTADFNISWRRTGNIGLVLAAIIYAGSIVLLSSVPPVSRDALTHHLALPKLYLQAGGIVELPHMIVSYYPQLLDLLYCVPLYFQNDIVCKYIHFLFALGTGWLIYIYLRNTLSRAYGWLGAFFFLTIPVIVKLSISVYVDLGMVFFSTVAMYLLFYKWPQSRFSGKPLCMAAVSAGLAAGTKYNGLIIVLLLTLLLPLIMPGDQKRSWKALICPFLFFGIAMAVFSPWMVRNYIWTHNPVYPLVPNVFPMEEKNKASAQSGYSSSTHFVVRKYVYQEKVLQTMLIPVRIFFQGKDNDPEYFDGVLSPFLFFLPFLAFVKRKKQTRRYLAWWIFFSVLFILIVFFMADMRVRYIAPAIPGLVIGSVYGLYNLRNRFLPVLFFRSQKTAAVISGVVVSLLLAFNIKYMVQQFRFIQPLSYLSGELTRDQYIARYRPEYPVIQELNTATRSGDKVLAVFLGDRRYYFDQEVRFTRALLAKYITESATSAELGQKLKQEGFTHVIVRYDLVNSWINNNFSDPEKSMVMDFFMRRTTLVKRVARYGAYRIL